MIRTLLAMVLLAALGLSNPLHAQSLADAAAEAARRSAIARSRDGKTVEPAKTGDPADKTDKADKTNKAPAKTYTNKDLGPVPPLPTPVVVAPGAPPGVMASTTDPRTEPYWRERRRAIDAKLHEDQMADKAAFELFMTMDKTGIMRLDPAAYVKAMNEMKRTSDVVHDDVVHVMPDFYAEGKRAGVPEEWLRPSDR